MAMAHWASSPLDRRQQTLFNPTLDQTISADHPVRLFGETLDRLDFSEWESMYVRVVGQPPIHPRVLAGCIIYGLSLGIRSSRRLEDAAMNRLDFIWLLQGRVPDHATLCKFRTQFGAQIKSLFRQVGRVAMELGLVCLNQVMLDGTDLKSNNSRHATNRRASLQQKQEALNRQIEQLLAETDAQDKADDAWLGEVTPSKLPRALRDLKQRQDRLGRAMENLKELEKTPRPGKTSGPAIPTTDPDSRVLSCKQGGYAPGYTAVVATDAQQGLIVDAQVIAGSDEAATVLPAVERIEQRFDRKPSEIVADSGFNTGTNLAELTERQVEPLMPARQVMDASAARRPDPTQPVAEAERAKLPMSPQNKKLDRSAFMYDRRKDHYHCPMGRLLPLTEHRTYDRPGQKGIYKVYESVDCGGCPLADRCLVGRSPRRRLCRDEYEELREAMAQRMNSEEGSRRYKRRAPVAERPFAVFKALMNFRQFLLRGIEKVRIEMDWAATAFNLTRLIRLKAE
jgi:transposase